jgi:integrase
MTRSELDLENRLWSIPGTRTKNRQPHTVPLSDLALKIIEEAILAAGPKSKFAFPSDGGPSPPAAVAKTITRACRATSEQPLGRFGITPWTAHDLRRTALTGMAKLGIPPITLGHVANHLSTTKAGVTLAVYARHTYDREKRAALNLWADRLVGIVHRGADIVPIRA